MTEFHRNPADAPNDWLWRTFLTANCLAILAAAVILRAWGLGHLPGVNGDEAWMGVQALRFIDGQPVAWWTPTGNLLNVFHFFPQVALHALLPPSVTTLRLPVFLSGILALIVNYLLCHYTFNRRTAVISTLLLAVMPVNIAYSRFAWDASQSLLFTLPVVYGALLVVRRPKHAWKWLLMASLSELAALVVHPTNIFVAPILVVAALYAYRAPLLRALPAARERWRWAAIGVMAMAGISAAGLLLQRWVVAAGRRLVDPVEMRLFASNYVDFLSGNAVYQFIVGSQRDPAELSTLLYRFAAWFALGCIAYGVYRQRRRGAAGHRTLLLGGASITLGLYLIAGPRAVAPHTERYAMCLIAATALLAAIGIGWWLRGSARIGKFAWIATAWAVLAVFYANYFDVMRTSGGESHRAFRTTSMEPKLAAVQAIVGGSGGERPVWIIAREWWAYWPTKYFTFTSPHVQVFSVPGNDSHCAREFPQLSGEGTGSRWERNLASCFDAAIRDAAAAGDVYLMEFAETTDTQRVERQLTRSGYRSDTTFIRDGAGRPLIVVIRPRRL